jgi:hypothetical protein
MSSKKWKDDKAGAKDAIYSKIIHLNHRHTNEEHENCVNGTIHKCRMNE